MKKRLFEVGRALGVGLAALFFAVVSAAAADDGGSRHGLSLFGPLNYDADFEHFDYVDPNAPKGGTYSRGLDGTFDNLNPFILKGVPAEGVDQFVFESLLEPSQDEPDAAYGLIARSVTLAPDRRSVTFILNAMARFHDGTPITAADVVFSYETLLKEGNPTFQILYADVVAAEALAPNAVRFRFSTIENRKLPLLVGAMPILSKAYYSKHKFNQTTVEPPLGSGPYRVKSADPGRSVVYERVSNYWAAQLPVRIGRHNFDTIRYDYYRDRTVLVEAFKAGAFNWHEEFTSKTWVTGYDLPEIAEGHIVKESLADNTPSGVQAFFINTRHAKFADRRVRQALDLAFDFEWTNQTMFHEQYKRMASYFENSELAARGLTEADELALLNPFRAKLPAELFNTAFTPAATDGSGEARANLRAAGKLLSEAGLRVAGGKLLEPSTGEPFKLEFLYFEPSFERVIAPYARNLEKLGFVTTLRLVDPAQYENRLKTFDFDLIIQRYVQSLSPGAELRGYFGSAAASQDGSRNLAGIKNGVVDALIETVLGAADRPALIAACRALDRVLLFGHYMVPQWYKGRHDLIYWNKFGRPAKAPLYGLGLDTWWVDQAKEAALSATGKTID
ncbi:MAG: ABC transporter substrate-binding protein [Alphaproteobacteria bacterium]|nr:ABC transporter substrate-binding protein [Alphaproteobacteria bacterium]